MGTICNNGFTYAYYFRNEPSLKKYINQVVSTLRDQFPLMFDKLEHNYHHAFMDNIYNYDIFCKLSWSHTNCVMISGVISNGLCVIPSCTMHD